MELQTVSHSRPIPELTSKGDFRSYRENEDVSPFESDNPSIMQYDTEQTLVREIEVCYPAQEGDLVLRTSLDWEKDVAPLSVSPDGTCSRFRIECRRPFLYFKPCLRKDKEFHWSVGANQLLLMSEEGCPSIHPYFFEQGGSRVSKLIKMPSKILGREHRLRAFLPPGYDENTLTSYPVTFLQDGQNLFFPDEAFEGEAWEVPETSGLLHAMGAVEDRIVVGVYSEDRMKDYTKPGYEKYAQALAEEVVPEVERRFRTIADRRGRSVMGSSLGGVVSFYTTWQYPDVFASAGCMSSTFSAEDDLIERVLGDKEVPDVAFYLDSGWPGDNYEVTAAMAVALIERGWRFGRDLFYLVFPEEEHDEKSWAKRLHLPFQLGEGHVARYSRSREPVLER